MTTQIKSIPMTFDYKMFQDDLQKFIDDNKLSHSEVDILAGVNIGRTSYLLSHSKNWQHETWLPIANLMDVDVRKYYVLEDK